MDDLQKEKIAKFICDRIEGEVQIEFKLSNYNKDCGIRVISETFCVEFKGYNYGVAVNKVDDSVKSFFNSLKRKKK